MGPMNTIQTVPFSLFVERVAKDILGVAWWLLSGIVFILLGLVWYLPFYYTVFAFPFFFPRVYEREAPDVEGAAIGFLLVVFWGPISSLMTAVMYFGRAYGDSLWSTGLFLLCLTSSFIAIGGIASQLALAVYDSLVRYFQRIAREIAEETKS